MAKIARVVPKAYFMMLDNYVDYVLPKVVIRNVKSNG